MNFTPEQLQILKQGFEEIFKELDIDVTITKVNTSKRSQSVYIKFNDRIAKTIRISSHKPVYSQMKYINIYCEEDSPGKLR